MSPPLEHRHLTIHGQTVAYRTAGSGPVVALIHGMAGSAETWKHVMPALAQRFTVVAPDLLGHGGSAKPDGEYSISAITELLDAAGLRTPMTAKRPAAPLARRFPLPHAQPRRRPPAPESAARN